MNSVLKVHSPATDAEAWYYDEQGHSQGPCSDDQMFELYQDGVITRETLVWQPSHAEWVAVSATQAVWSQLARTSTGQMNATMPSEFTAAQSPTGAAITDPPSTRVKPQAPSQPSPPPEKASFFKRLFGKR